MQVSVNSDVLFTTYLMRELPADLRELCAACGRRQIPIVLSQTAVLEFQHKQMLHAEAQRQALRNAFATLDRHHVHHDEVDPNAAVGVVDIVELMRAAGATVIVEEPSLTDFQEAHRRACGHQAPALTDVKSDEMRDLVIWVQATRMARNGGGLLLLSRDSVHVGKLGDAEAADAGLTRLSSIEDALGFLEVQSPAGRFAQNLLVEAAPSLRAAGLPLVDPVTVLFVRNPSFVQADFGVREARFKARLAATEGRGLQAQVMMMRDPMTTRFVLSQIALNQDMLDDVEVEFPTLVGTLDDPARYEERVAALRQVLGGGQ